MVLSVVLPVYNEQETIEQVIADHYQTLVSLAGRIEDWEIVCLDDASTDATPSILRRLEQEIPKLRVLTHRRIRYLHFVSRFVPSRPRNPYLSDGFRWPVAGIQSSENVWSAPRVALIW